MTTVEEALRGVRLLAIDTAPFIYFIERHPRYAPVMRRVLHGVQTGTLSACSSVITLTEVLVRPRLSGDANLERQYRAILLQATNFALVPIDAAVAERAAHVRASYRLRTPGALQVAAALAVGSDAFLTNDGALAHVADLRVLVLSELTV